MPDFAGEDAIAGTGGGTREDLTRRPAGAIRRVRWLALASWSAPLPPTLADCYDAFLADAAHLARLRPRTVRAYRYELAAAAADPRFATPLNALHLGVNLEKLLPPTK